MLRPLRSSLLALVVAGAALPATAQVPAPPGFVQISVAELNDRSGMTSDQRMPIPSANATLNPRTGQVSLRVNGSRGAVRYLEFSLLNPQAGQSYEISPHGGVLFLLRTDADGAAAAPSSATQGQITVSAYSPTRIEGTFQGTFANNAHRLVLRGRFESNLSEAR